MTDWHGNGGGWGGDAPVFGTDYEFCWGGWTWPYPDVWITVQRDEPTPTRTGRDCVWHYTPDADPDGSEALSLGSSYYREGMECDREAEHEKRIMCFQAAELLYLHASNKGNLVADLNLGYVYSYDRCEGRYWEWLDSPDAVPSPGGAASASEGHMPRFDHEAYASRHYRAAAEAGIAEACYKLGDLLRDGRGCDVDLAEAFSWFGRAWELGQDKEPVIWGSAALRIGHAYEEGEGCDQSFEQALKWYERATTGLEIAVRSGQEWYRGALRRAERGLARVKQELSGEY